jgi:prepilin-type N-terminal cleavage/methylation domain-containing protein
MHPRIVGRPPRGTPVSETLAFDTNALQKRPARAFTLIELLVVIAIIGILVGLTVPSLFYVYERARKTQAKNDLTQIVNAVNAYYTDYGKYPIATSDNIYGPEGTLSADLFYTLRAVDPGSGANLGNAANPRKIVFISPRVSGTATARSGIGSDGQYYDPWAMPYNVEIDGGYNNQITNPYPDAAAGVNQLGFGVIGWSYGKDQTKGTKSPASPNYGGSDDVISWQ